VNGAIAGAIPIRVAHIRFATTRTTPIDLGASVTQLPYRINRAGSFYSRWGSNRAHFFGPVANAAGPFFYCKCLK
jgi:hypothetical protein